MFGSFDPYGCDVGVVGTATNVGIGVAACAIVDRPPTTAVNKRTASGDASSRRAGRGRVGSVVVCIFNPLFRVLGARNVMRRSESADATAADSSRQAVSVTAPRFGTSLSQLVAARKPRKLEPEWTDQKEDELCAVRITVGFSRGADRRSKPGRWRLQTVV